MESEASSPHLVVLPYIMVSTESQLTSQAWLSARQRVIAILPGASKVIPSAFHLTPDNIHGSAGIEKDYVRIPGADCQTDLELFDQIFATNPMPAGAVIFVPDFCFREVADPIVIDSTDLRSCVKEFPCCVFDGDVLFISLSQPRISMFHHEGAYIHLDRTAEQETDPALQDT